MTVSNPRCNVLQKASFDIGEEAVRENIRNGSMSQWASGSSAVGVVDHDLVFWLGDAKRIYVSDPAQAERLCGILTVAGLPEKSQSRVRAAASMMW